MKNIGLDFFLRDNYIIVFGCTNTIKEGAMGNRDKTTLYAYVTRERKKALFHKLMDDGIFFYEWLSRQIDMYTKPPKVKRRKAA